MDTPGNFLDQITTRWPLITDPVRFVMRYAPAIRRYLSAIVRDPHDLDDVAQEFLLNVVRRGLVSEGEVRGRFRDYLKASIRNAALSHLRKRRVPQASDLDLASLAAPEPASADREWVEEWRTTLLGQAMEKLEEHERRAPDGRLHTVLCLARDHPEADSPTLAALASQRSGKPMSPEAFRKQLSRARALLANLLIDEVRKTLESPTQEMIDDELAALQLQELVSPYLGQD
jgi:RNA polymerase sigma-70 factor (ECF subfamily)